MEVAPVFAVNTAPAPQPLIVAGVGLPAASTLLTVTPAGSGSVTAKFVRFVSPGSKISIRSRELPPGTIVEGEKDLIPVTWDPATVTDPFAGTILVAPWSVLMALARIVFVSVAVGEPGGAVTWTVITQNPGFVGVPAGIVPPVKVMVRGDPAGVSEIDPPQVVDAEPGTKVRTVPGRVSDTLTPV